MQDAGRARRSRRGCRPEPTPIGRPEHRRPAVARPGARGGGSLRRRFGRHRSGQKATGSPVGNPAQRTVPHRACRAACCSWLRTEPRVGEPAQHRGDQNRVTRIVELELVDADQPRSGEPFDGLREPERAGQVGQFDERAEDALRTRHRRHVPQRRQQMRLADAEAAVEVEARPVLGRGGTSAQPPTSPIRAVTRSAGKGPDRSDRRGLCRFCRVRPVRLEADGREARRGHHLFDQRLGGQLGSAVDQASRHARQATGLVGFARASRSFPCTGGSVPTSWLPPTNTPSAFAGCGPAW